MHDGNLIDANNHSPRASCSILSCDGKRDPKININQISEAVNYFFYNRSSCAYDYNKSYSYCNSRQRKCNTARCFGLVVFLLCWILAGGTEINHHNLEQLTPNKAEAYVTHKLDCEAASDMRLYNCVYEVNPRESKNSILYYNRSEVNYFF